MLSVVFCLIPFLPRDDYGWKIQIDDALSTDELEPGDIVWRVCVCTPQLFRPQFIVIALILRRFEKRHQRKGMRFQEFNRVLIKHTQIYKYSS
jgi:hypothetical protein